MSNFLHLAKVDLKYANFGLSHCNDEIEVNYAAYHVNQAIEKIIKAILELNGEDLSQRQYRTHDISYLLSRLPQTVEVPDLIVTRKFDIMRWVSEPRYNVNFRQSKDDVIVVYKVTLKWLHTLLPPTED